MSKVNETLSELGIDETTLPAGLGMKKRKYDRMISELKTAKEDVGDDEVAQARIVYLEDEVFEYGEDLIAGLHVLADKRAEKEEKERAKEERRLAREAKRKEAEQKKAENDAVESKDEDAQAEKTESSSDASAEEVDAEHEQDEAETMDEAEPATSEEEMANATGSEEEKSSGIGLGTILIGGLVLVTTFGAYNYFKRR